MPGVGLDSSKNIYVVGDTSGSFKSQNSGSEDLFIIKYNEDGDEEEWSNQIGNFSNDVAFDVAIDSSETPTSRAIPGVSGQQHPFRRSGSVSGQIQR